MNGKGEFSAHSVVSVLTRPFNGSGGGYKAEALGPPLLFPREAPELFAEVLVADLVAPDLDMRVGDCRISLLDDCLLAAFLLFASFTAGAFLVEDFSAEGDETTASFVAFVADCFFGVIVGIGSPR